MWNEKMSQAEEFRVLKIVLAGPELGIDMGNVEIVTRCARGRGP